MNTKMLVLAMATAGVAMVMSGAAFASPAATHEATSSQASTAKPAPKTSAPATRAVPAPGSRNCVMSTGSHIPPPKGQCLPVVGTSYSQKDIQRTGAVNVGQALQMLDPSVTVHGH